jgi:hypothetical protein
MLRFDPTAEASREPAIDGGGWIGWYCEIPEAGNAMVVVVAYYRVNQVERVVQCLTVESLPRYRG